MGTVFTKFEKGDENIVDNVVDVELVYKYFYEENDYIYCGLTYDVTYRSGKINRVRINKVNTGMRTDQFTLSSNGTRNAIHWTDRLMWFDNYMIDTVREPEPLEVTIEEIEKKFGRFIKSMSFGSKKGKIVDKKEDEKDD